MTNDQWQQHYNALFNKYRPKLTKIERKIYKKAEALGMDGYEVMTLIKDDDPKPLG